MEREPISKKTRFEVLKRDKFTCQYCGRSVPDVILHIDHIEPVSKGGDSSILNLISACIDCNQGKSDRELSDDSILKKQINQLKDLEEVRQQKELISKWKNGLKNIFDQEVQLAINFLIDKYNFSPNDHGQLIMKKAIKKYGLEEYLECVEISSDQYLIDEKDQKQRELFFNKIERICFYRKKDKDDPIGAELRTIYNYANKKWSYCPDYLRKDLKEYYELDYSVKEMKDAVYMSSSYSSFRDIMDGQDG